MTEKLIREIGVPLAEAAPKPMVLATAEANL